MPLTPDGFPASDLLGCSGQRLPVCHQPRRYSEVGLGRLRLAGLGRIRKRLVEQTDHALVQPISHLEPVGRASDITNDDIDSGGARTHVQGRACGALAQSVLPSDALPFRLGEPRVSFGFLEHCLGDELDDGVAIVSSGNAEGDFVPHPLARRREVEVLTFDGEAVDEGDAAARGTALVGPVAGFEHGGAEEPDFDDLAADTVDLYPVANSDSALTHEYEPAEKGDDEVLQNNGESGGGQAENGGHLAGGPEHHKQDEQRAEELNAHFKDDAKRL